ncbi:hypothetical protein M407DRAFT_246014 [Tulasnella calospora MUT 4182]|uniref:Uncharacterized protein n=1 Tax=Tulasnella calospora MUT 4182 TaxID=1051891 RepID=A0A0C3Q7D0_9AGAM|nr:hypothetical protein M407DRAFT_246014 [Tulasnella calospora MUT 4182]
MCGFQTDNRAPSPLINLHYSTLQYKPQVEGWLLRGQCNPQTWATAAASTLRGAKAEHGMLAPPPYSPWFQGNS